MECSEYIMRIENAIMCQKNTFKVFLKDKGKISSVCFHEIRIDISMHSLSGQVKRSLVSNRIYLKVQYLSATSLN